MKVSYLHHFPPPFSAFIVQGVILETDSFSTGWETSCFYIAHAITGNLILYLYNLCAFTNIAGTLLGSSNVELSSCTVKKISLSEHEHETTMFVLMFLTCVHYNMKDAFVNKPYRTASRLRANDTVSIVIVK